MASLVYRVIEVQKENLHEQKFCQDLKVSFHVLISKQTELGQLTGHLILLDICEEMCPIAALTKIRKGK